MYKMITFTHQHSRSKLNKAFPFRACPKYVSKVLFSKGYKYLYFIFFCSIFSQQDDNSIHEAIFTTTTSKMIGHMIDSLIKFGTCSVPRRDLQNWLQVYEAIT